MGSKRGCDNSKQLQDQWKPERSCIKRVNNWKKINQYNLQTNVSKELITGKTKSR